MKWNIQLCELNYDEQELNAVTSVLQSEWLTMGNFVKSLKLSFPIF